MPDFSNLYSLPPGVSPAVLPPTLDQLPYMLANFDAPPPKPYGPPTDSAAPIDAMTGAAPTFRADGTVPKPQGSLEDLLAILKKSAGSPEYQAAIEKALGGIGTGFGVSTKPLDDMVNQYKSLGGEYAKLPKPVHTALDAEKRYNDAITALGGLPDRKDVKLSDKDEGELWMNLGLRMLAGKGSTAARLGAAGVETTAERDRKRNQAYDDALRGYTEKKSNAAKGVELGTMDRADANSNEQQVYNNAVQALQNRMAVLGGQGNMVANKVNAESANASRAQAAARERLDAQLKLADLKFGPHNALAKLTAGTEADAYMRKLDPNSPLIPTVTRLTKAIFGADSKQPLIAPAVQGDLLKVMTENLGITDPRMLVETMVALQSGDQAATKAVLERINLLTAMKDKTPQQREKMGLK